MIRYVIENKLLECTHPMNISESEEYYKNMVENFFTMYKYEIIDKIKDIIINIALNTESIYKKNFINKRIIYTNNYYLDEARMEKVNFTNIWYEVKGKAEIIYAMKEEGIYSGIVANANKDFDCAAVSFNKIESADNYDLQINTNNERQLSTKTLNIIKEYNLQVIVL